MSGLGRRVWTLWGVLLACAAPPSAPPESPGLPPAEPGARPERLVLLSIEGLVPDAYRPDASGGSAMPTLAGLAAAGVEADVV